jgi:hypothetical protein
LEAKSNRKLISCSSKDNPKTLTQKAKEIVNDSYHDYTLIQERSEKLNVIGSRVKGNISRTVLKERCGT